MTSEIAPAAVYVLCLLTSASCAGLLLKSWSHSRSKLLLWTALSFVLLAANNAFLVADLVLFPDAYLWPWRQATALGSVCVLLYGFIWEVEP